MEIYKLLIYGARDYINKSAITREFKKVQEKVANSGIKIELVVISGGAPGADRLGEQIALDHNCHVIRVDALWDTRRRSAGPQRNEIMALLEPHEAIGFHGNIERSKGTKDMKARLEKYGIPNKVVKR